MSFNSYVRRNISFADIERTANRFSQMLNEENEEQSFVIRPEACCEGGLEWKEWPLQNGDFTAHKSARFNYIGSGINNYPVLPFPETCNPEFHIVFGTDESGACKIHVYGKASIDIYHWTLHELELLRTAMDECMGTRSVGVLSDDENDDCKVERDTEFVGKTRARKFPYELEVIRVCHGGDFIALLDEITAEFFDMKDPSAPSFFHNRSVLADAFKKGRLYSLRAIESKDMYYRGAALESHFVSLQSYRPTSMYLLPCFCVTSSYDETDIVWTHPRVRRMGLASSLLRRIGAIFPSGTILPESCGFWRHMLNS